MFLVLPLCSQCFHSYGRVKKQSLCHWYQNSPHKKHKWTLHIQHVPVCQAPAESGILGRYFTEEDNGTVTANSEQYCAVPDTFLRPRLDELGDKQMLGLNNKMVYQPTLLHVGCVFFTHCISVM